MNFIKFSSLKDLLAQLVLFQVGVDLNWLKNICMLFKTMENFELLVVLSICTSIKYTHVIRVVPKKNISGRHDILILLQNIIKYHNSKSTKNWIFIKYSKNIIFET